jgi:hypothetical protein
MPVSSFTVPPTANPGMDLDAMKHFVRNHFEQFVNQKNTAIAYQSFS